MKNVFLSVLVAIGFAFIGCDDLEGVEYKKLEEFTLSEGELLDGEVVNIVYFGGGPTKTFSGEYYFHYVVSNQQGDLFNVFSPGGMVLNPSSTGGAVRMKYYSENTAEYAVIQGVDVKDAPESVKSIKNERYFKVISNPANKEMEENDYPCLIGGFATTGYDGDLNNVRTTNQ